MARMRALAKPSGSPSSESTRSKDSDPARRRARPRHVPTQRWPSRSTWIAEMRSSGRDAGEAGSWRQTAARRVDGSSRTSPPPVEPIHTPPSASSANARMGKRCTPSVSRIVRTDRWRGRNGPRPRIPCPPRCGRRGRDGPRAPRCPASWPDRPVGSGRGGSDSRRSAPTRRWWRSRGGPGRLVRARSPRPRAPGRRRRCARTSGVAPSPRPTRPPLQRRRG